MGGRELEARDCARAALQMPLWSLGEEDMAPLVARAESSMEVTTLETTQGQIDGFFSQFLFKCYLRR